MANEVNVWIFCFLLESTVEAKDELWNVTHCADTFINSIKELFLNVDMALLKLFNFQETIDGSVQLLEIF